MVTTFKYTAYSSASTALSTELDALTTDNYSALSAAIDNSSTLELYHDLKFLSGGSITPSTDGKAVEAYLVPSIDGTNYGTASTGTGGYISSTYLCATFPAESVAATPRIMARGVQLTPGKFKYGSRNRFGVTLAATGNTIKYVSYNLQGV